MTPSSFLAWRARMAERYGTFSQADAAGELGVTVLTVKRYEKPPARKGGKPPHPIPRAVALACAALEAALKPAS